jgi:hypothetical protein
LTSALVGGEWSASLSGRFTPGERAFGNRCIKGWEGLRVGLDDMEKRIRTGLELEPRCRPARRQSLYRLSYRGSCVYLIVRFCILLRVYPLMLFCTRFYCAPLTTCFGPDRWPSSGNTYTRTHTTSHTTDKTRRPKNNKYIIGTTRHLEDIHIKTRIPVQQVRSCTKLGHHN